ncbi:hypothetical protein [Arhodomonas sp. AD133]|uniref:hypothetical protein n=1 Tax=Arhodomonas sp. AD133 TaxID=3415009 RepID=UPI003EBD25B0
MLTKLERRTGEDIAIDEDIQRLLTMPEDQPLAEVTPRPPQRRANLYLADGRRTMKVTPMPVIVPTADPDTMLPVSIDQVQPPQFDPWRLPRADRRIDPQPLLRSMRIHRYLPEDGDSLYSRGGWQAKLKEDVQLQQRLRELVGDRPETVAAITDAVVEAVNRHHG